MATDNSFYLVSSDLRRVPVADHLMHGYEDKWEFYKAIRRLVDRWKGRVGECVDERHGFLLLRFHDTPGGKPDEEWLPRYILLPAAVPEYMHEEPPDETAEVLDRAFGFD